MSYFWQLLIDLRICPQIFRVNTNINFKKLYPVEAEYFQENGRKDTKGEESTEGETSGQTDKYIVANVVAFHKGFVNASEKGKHLTKWYFTNTISLQIKSRENRSGKILATEHVR